MIGWFDSPCIEPLPARFHEWAVASPARCLPGSPAEKAPG